MTTKSQDLNWKFWPLVPIYPYNQRQTIRKEIIKNTIWTFEQLQGILYVVVPIRMTVIRLESGGLLVYSPVAPTPECLRLINELVVKYGEIKYIILPTISGLEHKVFVGPFAQNFPQSQVFVIPNQWSFPLNLPLSWLGFPNNRTHILPNDSQKTPFADDFDYQILDPIKLGLGAFSEVAFFHKSTQILLLTDTIVSIPNIPPEIVNINPYPLLFHARDNTFEPILDSWENRQKGWKRICLFAFYFQPSMVKIQKFIPSIIDALKAPDQSKNAYWGWYPFQWSENWESSFDLLSQNGKLLVAPILQTLILNRDKEKVLQWIYNIAKWDFKKIIPCHFDDVIYTNPQEFRQAFYFLEDQSKISSNPDFQVLREIDQSLVKTGILPPSY